VKQVQGSLVTCPRLHREKADLVAVPVGTMWGLGWFREALGNESENEIVVLLFSPCLKGQLLAPTPTFCNLPPSLAHWCHWLSSMYLS
jgi:hypothetical protein